MPTEKRIIQGTTYSLFVSDTPNEAPTLLALHGFTGRGDDWADLSTRLGNRVRIIAPDLPGHGNSDIPTRPNAYAMSEIAPHLRQLIDEPCHLLGYSMGGRLALYLATQYPDKFLSLTLESASPGLKTDTEQTERRQRDNQLADRILAEGISWFVEYWENLTLWDTQTDAQKAYLHQRRLQNDALGLANSLRGMGTGVMPALWGKLNQLTMPTQLIVGAEDSKFARINTEMHALIPNVQLHTIPNAGHTVHLEHPDTFATLMSEFLSL